MRAFLRAGDLYHAHLLFASVDEKALVHFRHGIQWKVQDDKSQCLMNGNHPTQRRIQHWNNGRRFTILLFTVSFGR